MIDLGIPNWIRAARAGRHAVQEFEDGAVLIDLDAGDLFQLNATGVFVYTQLARGTGIDDLAALLTARFGIARDQALADVSSFLSMRPVAAIPAPLEYPSPFEYVATKNVLAVHRLNEPLLYIDPGGQWVTLAGVMTDTVRAALAWVVPKILVLQGYPVLHASAVSIAGRGLAFSGRSGAGKTTLARALAGAGASLLAEDCFVVRLNSATQEVGLTPLEKGAREWVDRALAGAGDSGKRIASDTLFDSQESPVVPFSEVMFLDIERRKGETLRKVPLGPTATAVGLLQNLFWASVDATGYQRGLKWTAEMSRLVTASELTLPDGLPHLLSAARRYTVNTAS